MGKLTPLKAIRARCLDCAESKSGVRGCSFDGVKDTECPLHPLRMGKGARATLKRIKAYCLWCCNGQRNEVRLCPSLGCPLWQYRFGRRPQKPPLLRENSTREGVLETISA